MGEPQPAPQPGSDLLVPTPPEWKIKYDDARQKLLSGEFADAAARFAELEDTAVNRADRAMAHAQQTIASEWAARGLAFVAQKDLGESHLTAKAVDRRSTDEIVSLYTNAVLYGLGTGIFVGVVTQPKTAAAGILPTVALTGASVGTVVAVDSGHGLRYGAAQSIVSGLYLGLEEGMVWGIYRASTGTGDGDLSGQLAGIVWGGATIGAVTGGVLGSMLTTTPGRAGWVGSTGLWSGAVFGFLTGAFVSDNGGENAALNAGMAAAGVGIGLGTVVGAISASAVSPTIARTRFLDLGGVTGSLLAVGLYAAAANERFDGHAASGVTALGALGGLGIAWALTSGMRQDFPPASRDQTPLTPPKQTGMNALRPMLMPSRSGAMLGVGGELD
jgi:hypothetical protein